MAFRVSYVITSEDLPELQVFKFGMTPYWAKSSMDLINARAEGDKNHDNDPNYSGANSIFLKRAFMKPIQSQRCLVISDAYYEWSRDKKPYLVYLQDKQRPFAFAGIYDRWKNSESGVVTVAYSIITTTANSLLQNIGVKRMPVILNPGYEKEWIKSTKHLSEVLRMLKPFNPNKMNAYPVSDLVNTPGENNISMISPIGEKLQREQQQQTTRTINSYHHGNKVKYAPDSAWGESRK
jgi:putative SOS response-associated peptidase YedK